MHRAAHFIRFRRIVRASFVRASLHGGGGPQVGEVTCIGGVKK